LSKWLAIKASTQRERLTREAKERSQKEQQKKTEKARAGEVVSEDSQKA